MITDIYNTAKLGSPKEAQMSEEDSFLVKLPTYPKVGTFRVDVLPKGLKLGTGWERGIDRFPYELLARMEAFKITRASGNLTRVVIVGKVSDITCFFYRKEDKTFIAYPYESKVIEQEVLSELDTSGGVVSIKEEEYYGFLA